MELYVQKCVLIVPDPDNSISPLSSCCSIERSRCKTNNDDTFPREIMESWGRDSMSRQRLLQSNAILTSAFPPRFPSNEPLPTIFHSAVLRTNHDHLPVKTGIWTNFCHCTAVTWLKGRNYIKVSRTTEISGQYFWRSVRKFLLGADSFSAACWLRQPHLNFYSKPDGTSSFKNSVNMASLQTP